MAPDSIIFNLIEKEKLRQLESLELIASENFVSQQVLHAAGSVLTNKYAEGLPKKRYYAGCDIIDEVEHLCIDRLKKLFNLTWANVQAHSGAQANAAVYLACLKPGDKVLGFQLAHGGHLTHGSPVNFSGKTYDFYAYGVSPETYLIDKEDLKKQVFKHKPKLIICGASAYSRDWDYAYFRSLSDEIGALLWADIAHPAGLIAKGLLNDPFDHCHMVTSTTHKTLRGPRGGVIMMRKDFENPWKKTKKNGDVFKMSELLDSAVFPGTQGGPLEHIIAAKAVAFQEALQDEFKQYVWQVKNNAQMLAQQFINLGYKVLTGGTDNHLLLLDLSDTSMTGRAAEKVLEGVGITVNKNMIPFDTQSPFITSGIRLGSPALTTRGMKEKEMKSIVDFIHRVFNHREDALTLRKLALEIKQFATSFPHFVSC